MWNKIKAYLGFGWIDVVDIYTTTDKGFTIEVVQKNIYTGNSRRISK